MRIPAPRSGLSSRWTVALAVVATLALGCSGDETTSPPAGGPVVLITLSSLRADAVGFLGGPPRLTPALDDLARQASWAGSAVAPSSWILPSMASLFTGLTVWQHRVWHALRTDLDREIPTLASTLAAAGYRTQGYFSNALLSPRRGFARGFSSYRQLGDGSAAAAALAALDGGPDFVWVHIRQPQPPWERYDRFLDRLPTGPRPHLPHLLKPRDLAPFFDPRVPMPRGARQVVHQLYLLNVARADELVGTLLEALRRSGAWDRATVVVTAAHGEDLGDHGRVLHGAGLDRRLIEVPLLIKLPADEPLRLALAPGDHPSTRRLWSTLVRVTGGTPTPGPGVDLFTPTSEGALSELYLGDGTNELSLVTGDFQLHWTSHFAPPDPGYWRASVAALEGHSTASSEESLFAIQERLATAFDCAPPLAGDLGAPRRRVVRWGPGPPPDLATVAEMSDQLEHSWLRFVGADRAPCRELGEDCSCPPAPATAR